MKESADLTNQNSVPGAQGTGVATQATGPDTASIANSSMTAGGMRGIGLVAFLIAQIKLKLDTVKLAKSYYRTNKTDFDNFRAIHEPGAVQSVSEAMSDTDNPEYSPDLYASTPAGISRAKIIDQNWFAARRRTGRYNTGAQRRLDYDMAVAKASANATGWNMGRRYEMAWADAHNERRFNRKVSMMNLGVGVGSIVRQGLATAVGEVASAQSGLASEVASIGNGYYEKQGYEQARTETRARHEEQRN